MMQKILEQSYVIKCKHVIRSVVFVFGKVELLLYNF